MDKMDELPENVRNRIAELVPDVVSGLAVAGVGTSGNIPAILLAAAVQPGVREALSGLVDKVRGIRRERVTAIFALAAGEAHVEPSEFVELATRDQGHLDLTTQAVVVAQDLVLSEQFRLVARTLAAGTLAEDPAEVDEEHLFLAAMSGIGPGHVRLLIAMPTKFVTREQLAKVVPSLARSLDPLLATLIARGLVEEEQKGFALMPSSAANPRHVWNRFQVTPYGGRFVERMYGVGQEGPGV